MRRLAAVTVLLAGCKLASSDHAAANDASTADAQATFDVDVPDVGAPDPNEPPVIPVAYDALRMWDRWPSLRLGMRTTMRSTFDRTGYNRGADAAHYLRLRDDGTYTALDLAGTGLLSFVRTNHWHGSPWHYRVDGKDFVVRESSTADPLHPLAGSTFLPATAFPSPLALTWSTTKGADLSWVSVPFTSSLELAYEHAFYGTGYYIVQRFGEGTARLSHPIVSWDEAAPPSDVVALLSHAGDDLAPRGDVVNATVSIPSSGAVSVGDLSGPRSVRVLRIVAPQDRAVALGRARVRITWDDRAQPSIDAPVALFFGAGTLYRRTDAEWLVRSFASTIRFAADGTVQLSSYWPMPFFRHAKIELVSAGEAIDGVRVEVRSERYDGPTNHVGYLHATYRDQGVPTPGKDLVLLDTQTEEGSSDWCGHFVGTSFVFSDRTNLGTLEGDPRFFFDDAKTPQAQGTGTEEWGGGGDYWGGETMTLPFAGHPTGAPEGAARDAEDAIESAYRFLLTDLMPFGRNARIQLEHGGENQSDEHYRTLAFWYGLPSACLVRSDALHVGDPADETAHRWSSKNASDPISITSRYEWGPDFDRFHMTEIFPAETDVGRTLTEPSEMRLAVPPKNFGVMLRRTFDQSWVDQRAEVWIADDREGSPFELAGVWYHAGSNRVLYGWTSGTTETTNGTPEVVTSNRRFREEELLLPRRLTEGRSAIRVRVVPVSAPSPLLPTEAAPPRVFSEIRYAAYAWVLPSAP